MPVSITETVEFPHEVKGDVLMNVLERIITEDLTDKRVSFEKRKNHLLGPVYRVGQRSWHPANHLIVTPTIDKSGIRPDVFYRSVEVQPHWWGGPVIATAQNTPVLQQQAARQLATKLLAYFWSSTNADSVWPQPIDVCVVCQSVIKWLDGLPCCPKHASEYPTTSVMVAPISE